MKGYVIELRTSYYLSKNSEKTGANDALIAKEFCDNDGFAT
jgi:hypothetical protein